MIWVKSHYSCFNELGWPQAPAGASRHGCTNSGHAPCCAWAATGYGEICDQAPLAPWAGRSMRKPLQAALTRAEGVCLKIIHLYCVGRENQIITGRTSRCLKYVHCMGNGARKGGRTMFDGNESSLVALLNDITPSACHHCNNSCDKVALWRQSCASARQSGVDGRLQRPAVGPARNEYQNRGLAHESPGIRSRARPARSGCLRRPRPAGVRGRIGGFIQRREG